MRFGRMQADAGAKIQPNQVRIENNGEGLTVGRVSGLAGTWKKVRSRGSPEFEFIASPGKINQLVRGDRGPSGQN
jgi:hypothetical protein